jgi:hypothetical protein
MKHSIPLRACITVLITGSCLSNPCLGSPFNDPGIPDGETITYAGTLDDTPMTVVESVRIKQEGGQQCYEITSLSSSLDRVLTLDKATLRILSIHTVRKFPRATLDSRMEVKDENPLPGSEEIMLADFSALTYIFRGFRFGELEKVKIGFYGEGRQQTFGFSASSKKKETITAGDKAVECYKIEFGLEGFWGAFLPKMNVWYSAAPPHYLVRYQGLSGPPGSPKRDMEVQSYEIRTVSSAGD